jgi:hypothetical protein
MNADERTAETGRRSGSSAWVAGHALRSAAMANKSIYLSLYPMESTAVRVSARYRKARPLGVPGLMGMHGEFQEQGRRSPSST